MSKFIKAIETDKPCFNVATVFNNWQIAYLNYDDVVSKEHFNQVERHMETAEIFILVEGTCQMIIGGNEKQYTLDSVFDMRKNTVYDIPKGVWHHVILSKDAKIIIAEESNTAEENGEYHKLTDKEKTEILENL